MPADQVIRFYTDLIVTHVDKGLTEEEEWQDNCESFNAFGNYFLATWIGKAIANWSGAR